MGVPLGRPGAAPAPRIEIIVPTLDSLHLLPRLVESLQGQSWTHWQVLFIDGPSGPAHRQWLEALCRRDGRFRWQPQDPDQAGIFGAMNQGFAAGSPLSWLLFWGSDDRAAGPQVLEGLVQAIRRTQERGEVPDLIVCGGRYLERDGSGREHLGRRTVFRRGPSYRLALLLGSTPPHQGTLIGPGARSHLARYAPQFRLSADLDYFLQLARVPDLKVEVLDLELVHMDSGGVSALETRRRLKEVVWAYRRAYGAFWALPFLFRYARRIVSRFAP
jgi:glycosyltransferase involved in cell wall biosynthesis